LKSLDVPPTIVDDFEVISEMMRYRYSNGQTKIPFDRMSSSSKIKLKKTLSNLDVK